MKTPVVILLVVGIALARGDTANKNNNQAEKQNGHQGTEPTGLDTASTRNAHMQYQGNRMENGLNQEQKFTPHAQMQTSQPQYQHPNVPFHSQSLNAQVHSQDVGQQQFHSQNQAQQFHNQAQAQAQAQQFHAQAQAQQFHNQNQAQQFHNQGQAQQFHNQGQVQQFRNQQLIGAGTPAPTEQEITNLLQSQQRMTPAAISLIQAQTKEQIRDFSAHQVYSAGTHPEQDLYQERRTMMDVQDKVGERRFGDSANQQNQVLRGVQSTEIRAGGFPAPTYVQKSAFDNREQPLVLPGVSQTHSTSVVVSGLKNLPVLPGLVYSAGPVPTAHAVAYSRPWFQGGAYVKQHWQTPYARYVYSHIL